MENRVTLFGGANVALPDVEIDVAEIIDFYEYFLNAQKTDPELRIPMYRAKIPSSGGRSFDIITGDEDADASVTKFKGVVAKFHNCNCLYPPRDEDGAGSDVPLCQSVDGVIGVTADTGESVRCADCPKNVFGSRGVGKECKNMRRLYILAEGCAVPVVMTLPPTSISRWEKYKSSTLGVKRLAPSDVLTEFSLTTATNSKGIKYSVVCFKAVGSVDKKARAAAKMVGSGESFDRTLGNEDYNVADGKTSTSNVDADKTDASQGVTT